MLVTLVRWPSWRQVQGGQEGVFWRAVARDVQSEREGLEGHSEWPGPENGDGSPARTLDVILWEGEVGRVLVT